MQRDRRIPWFVKGDIDGFFGLAVDNLVQILVIIGLCKALCGFSDALVYGRVLPGIAVSLLIGNLFYALHARWVARRDGNPACTALPYGINTPSVFAFILFILAPVYRLTGDAELTWKVGLIACLGSGLIEFLGAFVGGWIRRITPRAALLSALAAIGVIFIASPFAFQIFERPLVALLPMFIVFVGFFAKVRFPGGMPSGFVALILGTILAWTVPYLVGPEMRSVDAVKDSLDQIAVFTPQFTWEHVQSLFNDHRTLIWAYLGIIIPMGLINAVGSLQNIESAEAAGDRFATGPCMAVNGIGSIAAGLFGSCFPTTIYIGHPGWKALGARSGYSIINGVFFSAVFLLGLGQVAFAVIPLEAGIAIVMWIGIVITAQSYEAVPKRHYSAVAISFFPAVAAVALLWTHQILTDTGATSGVLSLVAEHHHRLAQPPEFTDSWWPTGIYALAGANGGYLITCIIISAASAFLIDRRFKAAGIVCVLGAFFTLLGFQHAYRIEPEATTPQELLVWQRTEARFKEGQLSSLYLESHPDAFLHRGYRLAAAYGAAAVMLFLIHGMRRRGQGFEDLVVDPHGSAPDSVPDVAPAVATGPPPTDPTMPDEGRSEASETEDDVGGAAASAMMASALVADPLLGPEGAPNLSPDPVIAQPPEPIIDDPPPPDPDTTSAGEGSQSPDTIPLAEEAPSDPELQAAAAAANEASFPFDSSPGDAPETTGEVKFEALPDLPPAPWDTESAVDLDAPIVETDSPSEDDLSRSEDRPSDESQEPKH